MRANQGWLWAIILCGGWIFLAGCNNSPATPATDQAGAESGDGPLTASIKGRADDDDEDDEDLDDGPDPAEPEEGSAEWHIREVVKLRLMPYPPMPKSKNPQDEEKLSDEEKAAKELEYQAAQRRQRNLQVIELAKQAIALTHNKADKELVFNVAVNHLLDSRLQLALAGDEQEDVDALYEVAEELQQRKPNSDAASAAAMTIVNFAHANAMRYAQSEPKWIQEFAKQAQLFATRVSDAQAALSSDAENPTDKQRAVQIQQDVSRAAQILLAAGQSCEAAGFADDAKACYLQLKAKFPETVPGQQVVGVVRRLNLKGQPLQLAGPTLDGNFLSIEDFKGKTVLVVFWSSQAKPFLDHLPALTNLLKRAQKQVAVVGINLDTDESQIDAFLEAQNLSWPQIFFSEPDKRGWNSPLAAYYGISTLPTMWIIDPSGVAAEIDVTAENVEAKLVSVVRKSQKAAANTTDGKIRQTGGQ